MGSIANAQSLQDLLAEALPKDVPFTFYHYSTPPSKSPALYNAPPHHKPERTYCESHFLAVSITPNDATPIAAPEELLVLAIEVLIYSTKQLTTIFVSKADSTGYLSLLNLPRSQAGSPLKAICGTFVSWLARERQRDGKKLVVSLFARAQDQYLFPASIDNQNKHVLDDRELVKWWCKVLDPIVREYAVEGESRSLTERLADSGKAATIGTLPQENRTAKGYLVIPGVDSYDTLRYTPPPPSPTTPRRWTSTHPLLQIAPHPGAPPRCLVPHFPDDPKSRFLDELDEELPDARADEMTQAGGTPSRSNGQWKSVKTLEQFWDMMAYRQECSSGRIVGFIWVVITPPKPSIPEEDEEEPSQPQSQNDSQESLAIKTKSPKVSSSQSKPRRRKVNTTYGPIPTLVPRIKSSTSNISTCSGSSGLSSKRFVSENTPYYTWRTSSRGTVLFSTTVYTRAHEVLLQQNFATRTAAVRSTKRWKDEIAVLAGVESWSWTVVGKAEGPKVAGVGFGGTAPVNVIGARKKRKPESGTESMANDSSSNGVHVLGETLVRKKAKVEEVNTGSDATNGITTLSAGLVRRKPKS